jgi:arylsulfatase A-like enzyme
MSCVGRYAGKDLRSGEEPYLPADELNYKALNWVSDQSSPVFLWIHYMDVHNPWYPREGTVSENIDEKKLTRTFFRARSQPESLTVDDRNLLFRAYEGEVEHFDRVLLDFVPELHKFLSNPVICLTSDHGELFGENDAYFHPGRLDEPLVKVPLLLSGVDPITTTSDPVSTVDIFPTMQTVLSEFSKVKVDGQALQYANSNRGVFAVSDEQVRIIRSEQNDVYDTDSVPLQELSDSDRNILAKLSGQDESTQDFEKSDLTEQLEALGYR